MDDLNDAGTEASASGTEASSASVTEASASGTEASASGTEASASGTEASSASVTEASASETQPVAGPSGLKRPAAGSAGGKYQKKSKTAERLDELLDNGTKNAIMKLNECIPGLQFVVSSAAGPVHSPTFTITVNYASQVFSGRGGTMKQAKLSAAEEVWRFLQEQMSSSSFDLSSVFGSSESSTSSGTGALLLSRSPLSLLNERRPGIRYEVIAETGQSHCKAYTISVTVEGREFTGTGRSKRMAKTRAARAAMETVYGCTFPSEAEAAECTQSMSDQATQQQQPQQQQQHRMLGDVISEMVLNKFAELTNQHTAPYSRYKVIAGVVMTTNDGDPSIGARLVSMATGSKCVTGEFISIVGKTVNDLHAENLAIRGCRLFILKEMEKLQMFLKTGSGDPSEIIVEQDPTGGGEVFAVKPSVKFHLFVSCAPCGHARILSSHERPDGDDDNDPEDESDTDDDGPPRHRRRGVTAAAAARLRAKVESGEGTVPVSNEGRAQTWDGVGGGEKLLTMSCTDRITRWNVLGIQGSLLSHLMKPIYLDSIVIGRLYNNSHLKHSLYGRIGQIGKLPPDYRTNQPLISPITHPGCRNTQKTASYSCHWTDDGTAAMEVIGTTRGRLVTGGVSRISKSEFYQEFVRLMEYFGYNFWYERNVSVNRMTYREVKAAAVTHRTAKAALYEAFKAAGLGAWVHCPREQQEFTSRDH